MGVTANGSGISFGDDTNVLEFYSGDGYTTLWIHQNPEWIVYSKMANFIVCELYAYFFF